MGDSEENRSAISNRRKAWRLVERVLDIHHAMTTTTTANQKHANGLADGRTMSVCVAPMGVDEMALLAERFFTTQQEFAATSRPAQPTIGFHYTRHENIPTILRYGLLSRKERAENRVDSSFNGDNVGDGIYVAADPISFHGTFGDVGILVACLHGRTARNRSTTAYYYDSIAVRPGEAREFHVVSTTHQCLPLLQFSSQLISKYNNNDSAASLFPGGNDFIQQYTIELNKLLDVFFRNDSTAMGTILFDDFIV